MSGLTKFLSALEKEVGRVSHPYLLLENLQNKEKKKKKERKDQINSNGADEQYKVNPN